VRADGSSYHRAGLWWSQYRRDHPEEFEDEFEDEYDSD
jgi:hypothetical protein